MTDILTVSHALSAALNRHCERIVVAGSIRRGDPDPKDIDIVCIPKYVEVQTTLFETGSVNAVRQYFEQRESGQQLIIRKAGDRMMGLTYLGVKVDVFFADEVNFGYILALRTGPSEFSRRLVTVKPYGMRPPNIIMTKGYIYNGPGAGNVVEVSTEAQLFKVLGRAYIQPKDRR